MSRKRKLVEESGSLLTFTGASAFRARLVLSILSARPIRIREIRSNDVSVHAVCKGDSDRQIDRLIRPYMAGIPRSDGGGGIFHSLA